MGIQKDCLACGGRFVAKRDNAKYCSGRCRQRAHVAPPSPPARREGAPIVALAPTPSEDPDSFVAGTRRELESAGRLDTYLGRAAMYLARIADSSVGDTGGGHASLMKEYKASMAAALDGAQVQETAVESLRRRAQGRVGAA